MTPPADGGMPMIFSCQSRDDGPRLKPLRPHQQRAIDGVRDALRNGYRRPMLCAPTGAGKCLGLGTPVMMFDGSVVAVETIVAGDALMGPDSVPRTVLSTCRGRGEMFRIVPVKGDPWICNDVHVLTLVETTSGKVVDIALDEYLQRNKTFKHCHKLFTPPDGIDFFGAEDPDLDPYFVGVWVGDGSKGLRGVAVTKPDAEIREVCETVAAEHGLRVRSDDSNGTRCVTHHIVGDRGGGQPENGLLNKLRALFVGGFPHDIKVSSRLYRQEFLAGVIDTDGHVANGYVEVIQKRRDLADGIAFVARSLGLKVVERDKVVNGVSYRRLGIAGDFVSAGIVTRIPRKRLACRKQVKVATRTGFRVESIGTGDYAGFEIDGDGRFLLGDFTVTHNTVIAAHVVAGARGKSKRVAFCVPAISLIDQTAERFIENGIDAREIGVIQGDHEWKRPDAPVQICSAQTLARRELPQVDVVVVDEAHIRHKVYEDWMARPEWQRVPFIGLSATPWAKGLGKHYDTLIKPTSVQELIDLGYLSKFRVFAPTHPDLSGVKTLAGDYHEGQLAERMSQPKVVGDVVEQWCARAGGVATLCFAVNRAHARLIHDQFEKVGIAVAYIDANTPREERNEIGRMLHAGAVKVVVNIGTLTTGIDWDVRCISLVRPTKSEMLFQQIIGRGLRTADGKEHCLILDHSDNHIRLGFVTDIDHDDLDMDRGDKSSAKKKDDEDDLPLPRECPICACLVPAACKECPECGHVHKRPVNVLIEDGDLGELLPGGKRKTEKREPVLAQLRRLPPDELMGQLKGYANERGKSDKWCTANYREIMERWPSDATKLAPSRYCSDQLRGWLRRKMIAWAKANEKRGGNHVERSW